MKKQTRYIFIYKENKNSLRYSFYEYYILPETPDINIYMLGKANDKYQKWWCFWIFGEKCIHQLKSDILNFTMISVPSSYTLLLPIVQKLQ